MSGPACACPDCAPRGPFLDPYEAAARPLERAMRSALADRERWLRGATDDEARAAGAAVTRLRGELDTLRREHGRGPWAFQEDRAPGWR